ncbi:MAG: hypothetical protein ED555_02945 [Allomuricauda sp.]|nr:MAG: hypothetical protein ED555_02945 [Allomuricauda sp.]
MIKFFRRIRQKLLSENRFSKYLIYALGEIILVMIGILLALQVNNWNEGKKAKANEIKLLQELRKDVAFSVSELDTVVFYNQKTVNYLKQIQKHLFEDLPYSKELDTAFAELDIFNIPYLPKTSYETLKVKGIDQLTNDRLKAKIIKVYDFEFQRLIVDYGGWEWGFNQNTTQRMMIGNVRRIGKDIARPNDYEALKKNAEFGNFLTVLIAIRTDHVSTMKWARGQVEELHQLLNQELDPYADD